MSVCIAAISFGERAIVSISDRMISTAHGEITAENAAIKQHFVHQNWFVMYSGDDVGCVGPIIRSARLAIDETREYSPDEIRDVLVKSYNSERTTRAQSEVLAIYKLDMDGFLEHGIARFGPERFEKMCQAIDQITLDVDFLVAGFDEIGHPHVFTLRAGTPSDYDMAGYWAIGSGTRLALAALSARNQRTQNSVNETIYNVCAARFVAGGAHGVGRGETILAVQRKSQIVNVAPLELIADVQTQWEAHTRLIPARATDCINAWLTPAPPEIPSAPLELIEAEPEPPVEEEPPVIEPESV